MAFGSIRMEPVFMVLGQSTATTASLSIEDHCDVQEISYEKLAQRLIQDGQILGGLEKNTVHQNKGLILYHYEAA